jgi:hypothetical protein
MKIKIYRAIILSVVLYGCETWLVTLMEECRLRVFENRVLRRIFGPKRDEVTVGWRGLQNEKLYALLFSLDIIQVKKTEMAGHEACMGERRVAYRGVVGKPEGRRPLGRPRHRWQDNITFYLREIGWGGGLDRSG